MWNLKNRVIGLVSRIVAFVTLLTLFAFYILSIKETLWIFRFEVEAGILFLFFLFIEIAINTFNLRYGVLGIPGSLPNSLKLACTIYVVVGFAIYIALPFSTIEGEKTAIGLILAILMIIFAAMDWIFLDDKETVHYIDSLFYGIYPAFYLIFAIFRPIIFADAQKIYLNGELFPLFFLDPKIFSPALGVVVAILLFFAVSALAILINNLISGKYKKRRNN